MDSILVLAILLPTTVLLWAGNMVFASYSDTIPISPFRWMVSAVWPLLLVRHGYKKKHLDASGAVAGWFVGNILTLASYSFQAALISFYLIGSRATKFMQQKKKKQEDHFKEGGQRNWKQVVSNGGVATEIALIFMLEAGSGDRPIDFINDYRPSWLSVALLGAISCCCGDTLASELGSALGSSSPRLVTTFQVVPRGTNGGISVYGTILSVMGGLVVGLTFYLTSLMMLSTEALESSPSQLPVILICAFAGFVGSMIDSLLGATLQYSGLNEATGAIVERRGSGVKHISGIGILDNHSVNLLSSLLTALLMPKIAVYLLT